MIKSAFTEKDIIMPNIKKNDSGHCPYCLDNDYDSNEESERNSQQKYMKCNGCSNWSIRLTRTGAQYPVRDQNRKEDGPVLRLM